MGQCVGQCIEGKLEHALWEGLYCGRPQVCSSAIGCMCMACMTVLYKLIGYSTVSCAACLSKGWDTKLGDTGASEGWGRRLGGADASEG